MCNQARFLNQCFFSNDIFKIIFPAMIYNSQ